MTEQRGQTLHMLTVKITVHDVFLDVAAQFVERYSSLLKPSKPGKYGISVKLTRCTRKDLCIVENVDAYLKKTRKPRTDSMLL